MREEILRALKRTRADYADVRIEREWRSEVRYEGPNLQVIESSSEAGGIVRCLAGGGWGIAVFNSLESLGSGLENAERMARMVGSRRAEKAQVAGGHAFQERIAVSLQKDPRSVSLQQKQELLQTYNDILLKHSDKIVTTLSRYADSYREISFANSEGAFIEDQRPDVTLLLMATASGGDTNIQTAFEHYGRAAGFEAAEGREEMAERAAERALALLKAKPVKGGVYTVVLDPLLTGVFIHEAFGHLCEADYLFKNPRLREILQPGRTFGVAELNVVEDGFLPGERGNSKYDDEGTLRRPIYLIRSGVLQGFMHSRETAAYMGVEPTGNARAISYQFAPIVRMRNTYIDRGSATFEQMLQDIPSGIYACSAFGGQTELEQFTFSAGYAYEIVDGRIGEMLRDVVLTGNVFETLKSIDCIGNDLSISGGAGGCGKEEQFPLPTTTGGPHIRVRNLTVGGRAA